MPAPQQSDTAQDRPPRRAARGHLPMLFAAALLVSGIPAQAPAPLLLSFTQSEDPELRGDAALLLAALHEDGTREILRKLTGDRDPTVRARAVVALGTLDAPGADTELGRILTDRDAPDLMHEAAAYALGSLPDDRATPSVDAFLARVQGGSARRHRDTLAALLAGMQRTTHPSRRAQVDAVLHDSSIRDAGLLGIAFDTLASCGGKLAPADAKRILGMNDARVRDVALRAMHSAIARTAELELTMKQLAKRDRDPRVRAAALSALASIDADAETRELARRALAGDDIDAIGAAVLVLCVGQGAEDRAEAALRARTTTDPAIVRAVLRNWQGVPTSSLVAVAHELATAADRTEADEALGLHVLANARDPRTGPLLSEFARRAADPALIAGAITDLSQFTTDVDPLATLGRMPTSDPARLARGVEAIGHLDPSLASRLARDSLEHASGLEVEHAREVLRAWRRALWPSPAPATLARLSREFAACIE